MNSLSIINSCAGGGVCCEGVAQPFLLILMYFLVHSMCRELLHFKGNCSICSCTFGVFTGVAVFKNLLSPSLQPRIAHLEGPCRQRQDSVLIGKECSEGDYPLGSFWHLRLLSAYNNHYSFHSILYPILFNSHSETQFSNMNLSL